MKFDNLNTLYMEHEGPPNCYGDSCAETSRFWHLLYIREKVINNGIMIHPSIQPIQQDIRTSLNNFITDKGYIRHPLVPEDWKETDFTSDQGMPLYLAFDKWNLVDEQTQMYNRLKENKWRTGNGDIIAPPFIAILLRPKYKYLADLIIFFQAFIMKFFPYRWNDGKKCIESTENSSGDYLNFVHAVFNSIYYGDTFISKWTRKLFTKEFINGKLEHYYKPETNVRWLLDIYKEVVNKVFR